MSANTNRHRLYDVGEAESPSRSVDSTVRTEGPMNRSSDHYDPYYSRTSPVGMVRAERPKYLGSDYRSRTYWEATEGKDPSSNTVVDPAHETEAAQLLFAYYEAVRRDRIIGLAALPVAGFGIAGMGVLLGWLFNNLMVGGGGVFLGAFAVYLLLNGEFPLPEKRHDARRAFDSSRYFRDRSILDGYLITTHDQRVLWEAVDLEQRRRAVDYEAVRLSSHLHLPEHRKTEIAELQDQEQELRRQIVDMLDPQHPGLDHLTDEVRAAVASRVELGRLSPEGGEQR